MHARPSFVSPTAAAPLAAFALLAAVLLGLPRTAQAQWQPDGVPVCTYAGGQSGVAGSIPGSIYLAWVDYRSSPHHIYAQRLDTNGNPQWTQDGIAVSQTTTDQSGPKLWGDGSTGVIVAYSENATTIRAQHLDSNGNQLWGSTGVLVSSQSTGFKTVDTMIGDGSFSTITAPGVVILWTNTNGSTGTPWVQSLTSAGAARWAAGGIELNSGECYYPAIVTNGTGSISAPKEVFAVWALKPTQSLPQTDIYAQRLSGATGALQWASGGIAITDTHKAYEPTLTKTATGTAIVAWSDGRNGNEDIYAQQLASGGATWIANGLPVCRSPGSQDVAAILPDGTGGAIIAWDDDRNEATSGWDIYAERIDASGGRRWALDGIPLCTAPGDQTYRPSPIAPLVTGDGASGMVLAWVDYATTKVMTQRVDTTGTVLWPANGVAVTATTAQQSAPALLPDFSGGAYVGWVDQRVSTPHIYANHVLPQGGLAAVEASNPAAIRLSLPRPNPSTSGESVEFDLPGSEPVSASVYDVRGALIRTLAHDLIEPAGHGELDWDGRDARGAAVPAGIYFLRFAAGTETEVRRLVTMH